MTYPKQHKQIVSELLGGKFITEDSPLFTTLQAEAKFYNEFFHASYGYELELQGTYAFLISKETTEQASRDLLLMLAVLAYEYHNDRKDFTKVISGTLLVQDITDYLQDSTQYADLLQGSRVEELTKFLDFWQQRNLLSYTTPERNAFRFKPPIQAFLGVAVQLAEQHLHEQSL